MARKFGRRGKPATGGGPEVDPRDLFGTAQPARQAARPASSTPLADQLNQGWPGVDPGYVVLPRSLAEGMSLPWQQQMAALLAQFHHENARLAWPVYRVVPSRYEKLVDLDEEQLAEAGYLVEMDTEGEMIYRERSGRKIDDPANTTVLVSCLDPIPKPSQRQAPPPPSQQAAPPAPGQQPPPQQQPPRAPAPMNIGPAPVWRTVSPPVAPPAGPPPAAPPGNHTAPLATPPSVLQPPPSAAPQQPPLPQPSQTRPPLANQTPPPPPVSAPPATPEPQSVAPPQAEPEPAPASPPPPATTPPPSAMPPVTHPVAGPPSGPLPQPTSSASPPQGIPVAPDLPTPPRGVPMDRGWFDELAESVPESSKTDSSEGDEFGPTGDPTEIPYRYRK